MLLNRLFRCGVVAASLAAAAACAHQPAESPLKALPEGSAWVLESSDVAGLENPAGSGIEIRFDADRLAGYSGCNQFSSSAALDADGVLTLGAMVATKRACLGEGAGREAALFGALAQVARAVSVGDDHLRVELRGGGQLVFVRKATEAE